MEFYQFFDYIKSGANPFHFFDITETFILITLIVIAVYLIKIYKKK